MAGQTTILLVTYFCILFALHLADPNMTTGYQEFVSGTYTISWNTFIIAAISGVSGLVIVTVTKDARLGIITALASVMAGWIVIPTSFLPGAPEIINTFVTTLLSILWGMAIISFVAGFES